MRDWQKTVEEYGPLVWHVLSRLLCNRSDVEDAFQATFIDVWKLDRRETINNWPAVLRHVATRRALDTLRQGRQASVRLNSEDPQMMADHKIAAPGANMEASELALKLRDAVRRLERKQAEVFCLVTLEGMPYADVAQQLGISVSYVGVLLRRARIELEKQLSDKQITLNKREANHELP